MTQPGREAQHQCQGEQWEDEGGPAAVAEPLPERGGGSGADTRLPEPSARGRGRWGLAGAPTFSDTGTWSVWGSVTLQLGDTGTR